MPPVDPGIVRERAARLREAGAAALAADLHTRFGQTGEVLIERPGRGRAPFYADIECPTELPAGSLHRMRFVAVNGSRLVGEPLS
jgi:threonylcarbamoyladenosine tRNA methylthiotransferase MtaB